MDVSLSELRELVMDREAWHAAIHGITKSQTQLSDWSEEAQNPVSVWESSQKAHLKVISLNWDLCEYQVSEYL